MLKTQNKMVLYRKSSFTLFRLLFSNLLLLHLCWNAFAFLNIEELKSINYGIEILDKPLLPQNDDEATTIQTVQLASVHGQKYQCTFPQTDLLGENQDDVPLPDDSVTNLLKPLGELPCLYTVKGWWTYEFCYRRTLQQYHDEGKGKRAEPILTLGHYESDFDWSNVNLKEIKKGNQYHSQQYVNGTKCDLTGKPRQAEVRFVCSTVPGDFIARVEEPQSCMYTLVIHTDRLCKHPYLKPRNQGLDVSVSCSPVLTPDEYNAYQHQLKLREELRASKKEFVSKNGVFVLKEAHTVDTPVSKPVKTPVKPNSNKLPSMESLAKATETLLNEMAVGQRVEEMVFELDEDDIWEGVKQEIETLAKDTGTDYTKYYDTLKSGVDSTVSEVKDEILEEYGINIEDYANDKILTKEMEKTVKTLLKKLKVAQKELKQMDQLLATATDLNNSPVHPSHGDVPTQPPVDGTPSRHASDAGYRLQDEGDEEVEQEEESVFEDVNMAEMGELTLVADEEKEEKEPVMEVRIVATGFYDEDDKRFHMTSLNDNTAVNKVLIAILGHSDDSANEIKRHQALESGYNFVIDKRKKNKAP